MGSGASAWKGGGLSFLWLCVRLCDGRGLGMSLAPTPPGLQMAPYGLIPGGHVGASPPPCRACSRLPGSFALLGKGGPCEGPQDLKVTP